MIIGIGDSLIIYFGREKIIMIFTLYLNNVNETIKLSNRVELRWIRGQAALPSLLPCFALLFPFPWVGWLVASLQRQQDRPFWMLVPSTLVLSTVRGPFHSWLVHRLHDSASICGNRITYSVKPKQRPLSKGILRFAGYRTRTERLVIRCNFHPIGGLKLLTYL